MDGGNGAMNEMAKPAREIAAFFDLDGTLLPKPSLERHFVSFLRSSGSLRWTAWLRWLARFAKQMLAWGGAGLEERWLAATHGNKGHLAGVRTAAADSFLARLVCDPLGFFPAALRRLAWHAAQDHAIYLVTGSLGPLAVCAAWQLARELAAWTGIGKPRIGVCATRLEETNGCWTGGVAGEAICGEAKKRTIERVARCARIDLQRSYAYGDRLSDRWMLESVGIPAAVNPSRALEKAARRRGWAVLRWENGETEIEHRGHRKEGEHNEGRDVAMGARWAHGVVASAGSSGRTR